MAKTKVPKSEKRVRMSTRRSANFTHHEKLVLLSLMREYRHIVEDRHTDGVTVREKNTAWVDLTNTYNAESDVSTRSLKQLRQCWKNLKSRSRIDFLQDETGNTDMGTLTLLPVAGITTSPKDDTTGSENTLTLVTVGGISTSTTTNEGSKSSPSNNASSIDNASTIILNNILTNNSNTIINNNNNSNSINSIPATNGIASENMSSNSGSPGLTNFSQALPITTSNRQRPESKTSSSNKKRKKKAPANPKAAVPPTAVAVDAGEGEPQEVSRQRRKTRPTLVHLDYDENGVLEGGGKTAETERPRRKIRPSVMHLDYDISTVDDDEEDVDGAVVADEDVSDRLHVNVAYPDDAAMVVSQSGHSQDADDDVYPSDTLAVVSVSGSADRIHFNSHVSTPDSDHIQPQEVNLHPQTHTTYRLTHPNTTSTNHNHPLQIQPASFQPSSNHLEPDENTTGSEHDIKVFDSIRGFGKVLHTQNALPTHLVSHVTDGHTVHSVNLGPSINYSGSVDIINNVPPSHAAPHIVPAHGANSSHIPSIEPVLLEKVPNNEEPPAVDFHKTEHSERMRNIRLERRLIGIEHKARMELIKLKSEYVKMKMEVLIHDRS